MVCAPKECVRRYSVELGELARVFTGVCGIWGLSSGASEERKALSFAIWLALSSADAMHDSKHSEKWGQGGMSLGFSSLPYMSQGPLGLAPVLQLTQLPSTEVLQPPFSFRKPSLTDPQVPIASKASPPQFTAACAL